MKAPNWLGEYAKQFWKQLFNKVDIQNPLVYQQLAMLCSFYEQFRKAGDVIAKEGIIIQSALGAPRVSPACEIQHKTTASMIRLAKSLRIDKLPEIIENVGDCTTLDEIERESKRIEL